LYGYFGICTWQTTDCYNKGQSLLQGLFNTRTSARLSVVVPLAVLTLIFGIVLIALLSGEHAHLDPAMLAMGGAVYLGAIVLLARYGFANIGRLERQGLTDSLSQLPNRRALLHDIKRLAVDGSETALALLDLDGFKLVNDQYGHFAGDRLIKECALMLREVCGSEARVYRLGGDEFAIMLVDPIAGNLLEGICRRLLSRFGQPIAIEDRAISVGASFGLCRSTITNPLDSAELFRRADAAMYASKRAGKMRCTWFNPVFDQDRETTRKIDSELRQAISNDELHVFYQPLVDANTSQIVAVEALLRWERPDGRSIGPEQFVSIAEESGLINEIGIWVLGKACRDALGWGETKLSVNVSAAQLRNPEFPILLGQILEETGFPANRLELELTETFLVLDPVVAGRSLEVIRNFGISIALDDFGTGYASIGFLRQFRFEKLKIDRSLVVEAATDVGTQAMMVASIAMARALDMAVTAEGVETQAQADLVRIAGCDQIQGWLYYKAMSASDIAETFANEANVGQLRWRAAS
jgi:diguanylate cyclase (GGDEF)-like protein